MCPPSIHPSLSESQYIGIRAKQHPRWYSNHYQLIQ